METVLRGCAEQVEAVLGEGGYEERSALDVENGIGAGVDIREKGAGFFGGKLVGWSARTSSQAGLPGKVATWTVGRVSSSLVDCTEVVKPPYQQAATLSG